MRDNRNDPTPRAVYCAGDNIPGQKSCGLVFLTDEEHHAQMMRPNHGWHCPKCLSSANWDDECQETNPPEEADA